MRPPRLDGRGKSQSNRHRMPDEVELPTGPFGSMQLHPSNDPTQPDPTKPSVRERLARTQEALGMIAEGWSITDIAEKMRVQPATVTGWVLRHRRVLKVKQIDALLDGVAAPLAAQNLVHGLLAGDKDYTLKTLEGRGHFRRHTAEEIAVKHEMPPLVIRFETPVEHPTATMGEAGRILGVPQRPAPKQIEGHVVASTPVGVVGTPAVPVAASTDDEAVAGQ
jgi:hypothetical protein